MTRNRKANVSKIVRRLRSVWGEQNAALVELDEIRSRLYQASTVGSNATSGRASSKMA
jgi:hypothetical protein